MSSPLGRSRARHRLRALYYEGKDKTGITVPMFVGECIFSALGEPDEFGRQDDSQVPNAARSDLERVRVPVQGAL